MDSIPTFLAATKHRVLLSVRSDILMEFSFLVSCIAVNIVASCFTHFHTLAHRRGQKGVFVFFGFCICIYFCICICEFCTHKWLLISSFHSPPTWARTSPSIRVRSSRTKPPRSNKPPANPNNFMHNAHAINTLHSS